MKAITLNNTVGQLSVKTAATAAATKIVAPLAPTLPLAAVSPNANLSVPILAETDDYLVVNKPAGLVVHQSVSHPAPDTMVNALLAQWPPLAKVGDDLVRPGIVQRLDQDVSGVMVVAKTPTAFNDLKDQFQRRLVDKKYLALAHGRFNQSSGTINFPLARSARNYSKMAALPAKSENVAADAASTAKSAITHYTVLKQWQHYALLELHLETGRTHQLRVHLNAIGHPLVGEQVYLPRHFRSRLQPGRIFLHAASLGFTEPNGLQVNYAAPLPAELQQILDGFSNLPYTNHG